MNDPDSPRGVSDELDHSDPSSTDLHVRTLPDDLPKSLDDRRSLPVLQHETEMYDAWQGAPLLVPPLPLLRTPLRAAQLFAAVTPPSCA